MHARFIPRLLIVGLMLTLAFANAIHFRALAADRFDWTDTNSQESVLVQKCNGFDITTSYSAEIAHHLIADNTGNEVTEQLNVSFAGSLGNAATGKSYQYDGKFTRWSNYIHNNVTITDLELRFEVGTPGQFSITADRIEMDLVPDPAEVIKTFVPNALQMELCYLLTDTLNWNVAPVGAPAGTEAELSVLPNLVPSFDDRMGKNPSSDIHTENSAAPELSTDSVPGNSDWCDLVHLHGLPC
jgi:hypothetical protein